MSRTPRENEREEKRINYKVMREEREKRIKKILNIIPFLSVLIFEGILFTHVKYFGIYNT